MSYITIGLHLEVDYAGKLSVRRYIHSTKYDRDRLYKPVIQMGRKGSQSSVAANILVFDDVDPRKEGASKESVWEYMKTAPKFRGPAEHDADGNVTGYTWQKLIAATPPTRTSDATNEELRREVARLNAENRALREQKEANSAEAISDAELAADVENEIGSLEDVEKEAA